MRKLQELAEWELEKITMKQGLMDRKSRLFGKAQSSAEAVAVSHTGDIPTVECLCGFVFANLGVAVQNLRKIKASVSHESVVFHGFILIAREQTPDTSFWLDVCCCHNERQDLHYEKSKKS